MAMNRREFVSGVGAFAAAGVVNRLFAEQAEDALDVWQRETDLVKAETFRDYLEDGKTRGLASLEKLERAFEKVFREARETTVGDVPAVWSVYNMGYVVKTRESLFSIDLVHRRSCEFAPLLDFALITHNHGDHFTEEFYKAMDGAGKTVISNFKGNYGTKDWKKDGGYTRAVKTFAIKDVTVRTSLTDHNDYLVDFTTAFEVHVGKYTIYHSGDCSNVAKLNPTRRPDLWIVHPYCGMKTERGVEKMKPQLTAIAHLNELGHARNRWRWTWADGFKAKAQAEEAGGKAIVPVWGERIV